MFQACEGGKPLKSQAVSAMNKCTVKDMVKENIDGCKCSLRSHAPRGWYASCNANLGGFRAPSSAGRDSDVGMLYYGEAPPLA